tara:strand:- start:18159 stop:19004 length:846 start_codon:yes stop_codon:yes gene_type:complete
MRLHCLGTAGYHPNSTRHTSCYFLPESGILLDAGSGIFRITPLVQTRSLDILLSHAHLDHILGLTFLLDMLYQLRCEGRPVEQLRIWGEAEKIQAVRRHLFSELIFPVQLETELGAKWCEIDSLDQFEIGASEPIGSPDDPASPLVRGPAKVTWRPQQHPGGSVAYRIDWDSVSGQPGKRLVYATDTTGDVSDEGVRWSGQADLLMHECYFRDSGQAWAEKTGHCWTSRLIDVVRRSRPRKTLITHVNPLEMDENSVEIESIGREVDGEVTVAEDGQVVDF